MDLLRNMTANRQVAGLTIKAEKMTLEKKHIQNKSEILPGSKTMRKYIIEKKPNKKVIKEHIEAIIAQECESSSDESE